MVYQHILLINKGALRIVKFNNPKKNNALNKDTYLEIARALNEAALDDSVSVVALTGAGDYYSSGNDLSALLQVDDFQAALDKSRVVLRELVYAFIRFPKLLVAVVNGPCIGIAATTIALCDIALASETTYFYTPFTALGISVEGCASYTFPRILGRSKANEMLLLNHKLHAAEALQFNFVSEVFKKSELDSKIWPKVEEWSRLPKQSIKVSKSLMNKFDQKLLEELFELEVDQLHKRFQEEDAANAIVKFMSRKSKL